MKIIIYLLILTSNSFAQNKFGYLTAEEQKYYKNDSMEGLNQRERIDSTVKEINKLHGEIASLKAQLAIFRKELDDLKKPK